MPSMSAHMAVAKKVSEQLNIDDYNFIKGNILPDLYDDKNKSHFKIKDKKYLIPNIEEAINELEINNNLYLGYITHLLLDKYYLENFLDKYDFDVFKNGDLYEDYDYLNDDIINYFKLDINYIKNCMKDFSSDINNDKLIKNIDCLLQNKKGQTKIIKREEFLSFLDKTIDIIIEDIKTIMGDNYGRK